MKNLISSVLMLLFSFKVYGATIYVPQDYTTIQAAIDNANDEDIISVASGTYNENIIIQTKNISVIGENQETTFIEGNTGPVVTIYSNVPRTAILSGFTITGGSGNNNNQGGGVFITSASPTLRNLTVKNNSAYYGAGIYINSYSDPLLDNLTIYNNNNGEGIFINNDSDPMLTNITIYGHTQSTGGGITVYNNSHPILARSIVWGNWSTELHLTQTSSIMVLDSNIEGGQSSSGDGTLYWGSGNTNGYPNFLNSGDENFGLQATSPCVGQTTSGNYTQTCGALNGIFVDIPGDCSFDGSTVDFSGECLAQTGDFGLVYNTGAVSGDVNLDGVLNLIDVINSIKMIVNP